MPSPPLSRTPSSVMTFTRLGHATISWAVSLRDVVVAMPMIAVLKKLSESDSVCLPVRNRAIRAPVELPETRLPKERKGQRSTAPQNIPQIVKTRILSVADVVGLCVCCKKRIQALQSTLDVYGARIEEGERVCDVGVVAQGGGRLLPAGQKCKVDRIRLSFPDHNSFFPQKEALKTFEDLWGRNVPPGLLLKLNSTGTLRLRIVHAIHIASMAILVFASPRSPNIGRHGREIPVLAFSMTDCVMPFSVLSTE
ncbi:hypothetical protein P171DRAFT_139274 [Karstenula rhodostoma CBS 690.94]|uniref:Uncharacterized protein n=1 Tax=Karstenula rhodostoma CBS 690.94 TaxID=1392251 RepID=A0A9P4UFU0_9PLEO|nr:hypothetical protein P171DRAFT_139274 [Karstenula rhodostoma CBS 690.94]